MLAIVGAILLGAAVFYIAYVTQISSATSQAEDRLGTDFGSTNSTFNPPLYIKLTKHLLKGSYLKLATGFWKPEKIARWKKTLISAGIGRNVEPEQFVASKFWLAVQVGIVAFLAFLFADSPPPPWLPPTITLVAFFYPNLTLDGMIKNRQSEIRLAMPYVVDLLTLSTEAGLDFMGSIQKVVDRSPPSPLIEELSVVLKDIQLGKTRAEALRDLAERCQMSEMTSFVAVLVSSDQMGASIGTVLRAQSDSMRTERLVKAEKLGAQASQKILLPLVFFILPAVFLMIFGPIILQFLGVK